MTMVALKSGPGGDHRLEGSSTPSLSRLRALRPTVASPLAPRKVIGNWKVVVAKLIRSQPSPYSVSGLAEKVCGRPKPWPIS